MCNKAVKKDPWALRFAPYHLKTQKMCDDVVWEDPFTLHFIPDWFITQQQLKTWDDYYGPCNNDRLIKWYAGYKKRKAQKAKIKDELMPIAWHPSRWWDWCVTQDEKKETEQLWKLTDSCFKII